MTQPWDLPWGEAPAKAWSFDDALRAEGVTGQLADVARSIYQQESSSGANTKTSNAGARGGMQIRPSTFADVADKGWNIDDPDQNARAGIRYLRQMHERAGGDPALAAAGYYGGPGGLEKARRGVAVSDPRNPNAPTTLEYGRQVAARLPAQKSPVMQGIEAMTNAIVPSAQAAQEPNPWEREWQEPPAAAPAPEPAGRGMGSGLARQIGLTARAGLTGIASGAEIVTEPIRQIITDRILPDRPRDVSDLVTGAAAQPKSRRLSEEAARFADWVGLPKPENATERIVQDAASAMAGVTPVVAAGGVLSRAAGKVPQAVGQVLAAGSGLQTASAAASGGAAGATREAGGGEIAQAIAALLGGLAVPALASKRGPGQPSQTLDAAKKAREAGYVIPPADIAPGDVLGETLGGLSGKIKTAQVASSRNQARTNELIRKEIGLPEGVDLTPDTLQGLRNEAAKAYGAVAGTGTVVPGTKYAADLDKAVDPFLKMARSFPGRTMPPVVDDIQSLKTAAFDADDALETIRVLRSDADGAYRAGNNLAGKAYKSAAAALEDALGSHLKTIGAPKEVLDNFRAARQAIARTYSVQSALQGDGSVSGAKLAGQLARGKPITGELRNVAEIAGAYPRAMQALKESPKALSPLDFVAPSVLTGTTGNAASMLTTAARPVARSIALSGPMQRYAIAKAGQGAREAASGTLASNLATGVRELQQPRAQNSPESEPLAMPAGLEGPWQMDWGGAEAAPEPATAGAEPAAAPAVPQIAPGAVAPEDAARAVDEAGDPLDPTEPAVIEQLQEQTGGAPLSAGPPEITQPLEPIALASADPVAPVTADGGAPAETQTAAAAPAEPGDPITAAANEAATSPTNDRPEPTEAQREAGNYKMGHIKVGGLDVTVEHPNGSTRKGRAADGTEWERPMTAHYGYIRGTEGADGEQVDVYVGPRPDYGVAYVVDQVDKDGKFDEHKVLLGYTNLLAAKRAYSSHYPKGFKVGKVTAVPVEEVRSWLKDARQPVET